MGTLQYLNEALTIFQDLNDQRQKAITSRESGMVAKEQDQLEEAHRLYEEALTILSQLEDRREVTITRLELAILVRQQGRSEEAQQLLTEVLTTTRQIKDRYYVARALNEWGLLMQAQEQLEQALPSLLHVYVGLTLMNSPDAADVKERLGQLRTQIGEDAFLSTISRIATEAPESAYDMDQTTWATAVRKLAKQPPLRTKI